MCVFFFFFNEKLLLGEEKEKLQTHLGKKKNPPPDRPLDVDPDVATGENGGRRKSAEKKLFKSTKKSMNR